jgi:Ca2+-binding EF-hand superfamily protein
MNTISFNDFITCLSTSSFGNLKEKAELAFRVYDIGKYGGTIQLDSTLGVK